MTRRILAQIAFLLFSLVLGVCSLVLSVLAHWLPQVTTGATVTGALSALLLVGLIVEFLYYHGIRYGVRYFFRHAKICFKIIMELQNAKVINDGLFLHTSPTVRLDLDPDLIKGRLKIHNTARFAPRLENLDVSPNLSMYRVEEVRKSRDENWLLYDFIDAKRDYRLTFNTLDDFKAQCLDCGTYQFFLDARTRFTLCHALIVGGTGSGKTYLLYSLILQCLLKKLDFNLYLADAKGADVYQLGCNIAPDSTARDEDEIIELLERFQAEMTKRQHEMADALKDSIDKSYMDFGMSPHVLIFDELTAFLVQLKTRDKATRDKVTAILSNIVLKGRSVGCFLIVAMQKSDASTIDTAIRDNLVLKVCLGNAEPTTITTCFGAGADVPQLDLRLGEGFYTLQGQQNKPKIVMGSTIDFDILGSLKAGSTRVVNTGAPIPQDPPISQ